MLVIGVGVGVVELKTHWEGNVLVLHTAAARSWHYFGCCSCMRVRRPTVSGALAPSVRACTCALTHLIRIRGSYGRKVGNLHTWMSVFIRRGGGESSVS